MKKYAAFIATALLLLASCSEESITNDSNPENKEIMVTFNLALRQEISPFRSTRNMPEDLPDEPTTKGSDEPEEEPTDENEEPAQPTTTLSYVEFAVYSTEGDYIRHARKPIEIEPDGSTKFILQEPFTAGTYKVCFLAHSIEEAQFTQENNLVTFPTIKDSFWGNDEIEIDATQTNQSFDINIKRAIAGIEFRPTDQVPEQVHHFEIETSGLYNSINLLDGTTPETTAESPYSYAFTEEDRQPETLVSQSFYTFVPEKTPEAESAIIESITLKALTEDNGVERTRTITEVPIYRNKITRYTGTLYTPSIVDGEFTVSIDTEWEGYVDKELDTKE